MKYDYYEAVKNDICEYIAENGVSNYDDLYDKLFMEDSVTGNASGSYTFSKWRAEENLCHNMDTLRDALKDFGFDVSAVLDSAETCDVIIRCYLLGEVLDDVLNERG